MLSMLTKKIPKKILIPATVLLTGALFISLITLNLEKSIESATALFFNFRVKTQSIKFKDKKIYVKNIKFLNKSGEVMAFIPKAEANYNSLLDRKLKDIKIEKAQIFVRRDKNGEINFVKVFNKKSPPRDKEKVMKNYKPSVYKFADNLYCDDIEVNYEDLNYSKPIRKQINAFGKLSFNEKNALEIYLKTKIDEKNDKEIIEYTFSNEKEPYSMNIKVNNFKFDDYWGQYIWDNPKIHYLNGYISSDIKISFLGYFGEIKLNSGALAYDDFEEKIKDINIEALFNEEDIKVLTTYNIFDNKEKIDLNYTDGELNIFTFLKDINSNKILKYKPLQNKNLNFSKINIKDVSIKYNYSKKKGSNLNVSIDPNNSEFKNIVFKDFKLNYYSKNDKKNIRNSYLLVNILGTEEKISFDMNSKKNIYDLVFNVNSKDNNNIIPNVEAKVKIKNSEKKLGLDFISDIVNFKGNYSKNDKLLKIYGNDFIINYDNKKNNFIEGLVEASGKVKFFIYDLENSLDFVFNKQKERIEINKFISLKKDNKKNKLELDGYYNFKNNNFFFNYISNNFKLEKKYKKDDILLDFSGNGSIEKQNGEIFANGKILNLSLKYKMFLENLKASYFTKKEKGKIVSELHGEIGKFTYSKYSIASLKVDLGLKENILRIFGIENSKIFIKGKTNLKEKKLALDFDVKNLNNKDIISLDKLYFNLGSLRGSIFGDLKNPSAKILFDNLTVDLDKYGKLNSQGKVLLKNKKISVPNIEVENHKLSGYYDIVSGKYKAKVNIFEENINKYSSLKEWRGRLISQINIYGENKNFTANIEGSLDRIFFKSKEVPNFYFKGEYGGNDFLKGKIEIEKIAFLNNRKKEFFSLDGYIDLAKQYLEIFSKGNNQQIDLTKLEKYTGVSYIEGHLATDFFVKGSLKTPYYKLNLKSNDIKIKGIPLDKVEFLIDGDLESINLKKLNMDYSKNIFYGSGNYVLKDKSYSLNLKSNKLDFLVLNKFLKDKNFEELSGKAELDIKINSNNSRGFFRVYDLNLKAPKYNFKLSNLNSSMSLKNNQIVIDYIKSKVNNGDFKATGFFDIPNSLDKFDEDIFQNLNYRIDTKLNNFEHSYPEVSDILLHSNITLSNKKIEGTIYLDKGVIHDIPNDYKSIWKIILSFLFKKKKDIKESEKYILPSYFEKLPQLNLALIISNPLILDMNTFTTFVDEVKGKVYANLNLKGEKGNFYVLGNGEIQSGYLVLNSNKFTLDRALVSFNKKNLFLPNFDPNISIESRVNINNEDMGFNISGSLKKLRYDIISKNGNSNGDLNSLIEDIKKGEVNTDFNTPYYTLLQTLVSDQITQTIFGKTTKFIKRMFSLNKLRLRSDFSTSDVNNVEHFNDGRNSVKHFKLNTILEVEDNLYKNKIYLNANTKLFSTNTNLDDRYSKANEENIREYDVNLEYRHKDYSIGIGAGSIPERYRTDRNKDYNETNYHIDFKFRKKFNHFSELFSF